MNEHPNLTRADIITAATACGTDHGRSAGSWVIDGNTSEETARAILQGYEDCDPAVMDMMPAPLSGEWAGESIRELVEESGLDWDDLFTDDAADHNDLDDWCDAYETAFEGAYWAEVVRAAAEVVGDAGEEVAR